MLAEVLATKPYDGVLRQRWFTDEDFDLTVWYAASGEVHGFQLSFDKRAAPVESVLTWHAESAFDLTHIDGARFVAPMLRPGGRIPDKNLVRRLQRNAKQLAPDLKRLLFSRLRDYVKQSSPESRISRVRDDNA